MDTVLDEINHDGKDDITNHETNNTTTAKMKINNVNASNKYGSLNKDGILGINSTTANQILEKITPNEQNISLETCKEKRYRKISLYISCATLFFFGMAEGMLTISIWSYMKKVCVKFKSWKNSIRKLNICVCKQVQVKYFSLVI